MKKIRAKLHSQDGATMVFALTVFLIITVISAVMLNGALSAVQNTALLQKQEKALLSGRSAARLLEKELADTGDELSPDIFVRNVVINTGADKHVSGETGYTEEQAALSTEISTLRTEYSISRDASMSGNKLEECQIWNGLSHEVYSATATSSDYLLLLAAYSAVQDAGAAKTLTLTDVKDSSAASVDMLPVTVTLTAQSGTMKALIVVKDGTETVYQLTMVFTYTKADDTETVPVHYSYTVTESGVSTDVTETHNISVEKKVYRWKLTQVIQGS